MTLVDANILLYAVDSDSPFHAATRSWWEEALSSSAPIGLTWIVILAFLRLTTRSGIFHRPLSIEQAAGFVEAWLDQPCVRLVNPGPRHWETLRGLIEQAGTAGNLTTDAHLAAIALDHDGVVCTADGHFRRFGGVRVLNPMKTEGTPPPRQSP